ncbi:hypothetical protein K9M47_04050 [Candidatus Gracilibacteria bacterium]|nr:hypothetical protein [Candidatus Gracilibacteria bacterium]
MKIDYLSCTKMLYFAERLLKDYYELPDIDKDFANQFDMTTKEVQELCKQFENGKLLVWNNISTEIEDDYGNISSEISYDALTIDKEKVIKEIKYLKERYGLRQNPFTSREALTSIVKQIELVLNEEERMRAVNSFSTSGWQLKNKDYTLVDLLFRHAYANVGVQTLPVVLSEFLNPIYYDIHSEEISRKLSDYIDKVLLVSSNKEDYKMWNKEAEKYVQLLPTSTPSVTQPKKKYTTDLTFPEKVKWEKVTIKIKEGQEDIEIFYNDKFIKTADYIELGFSANKKEHKPDMKWHLLCIFSILQSTDISKATVNNLIPMLNNRGNRKTSKDNVHQTKKNLSKTLQNLFKTNDDPFIHNGNYYEPRMKILPEPALRNEALRRQGGSLVENINYNDIDE